jgi:hypothetical protein
MEKSFPLVEKSFLTREKSLTEGKSFPDWRKTVIHQSKMTINR